MRYDTLKSSLAENLELPKEVVLDLPLISVTGDREITIDNFKNIREFSEKSIGILAGGSKIYISGSGLEITYLTKESLTIKGKINQIQFSGG